MKGFNKKIFALLLLVIIIPIIMIIINPRSKLLLLFVGDKNATAGNTVFALNDYVFIIQ